MVPWIERQQPQTLYSSQIKRPDQPVTGTTKHDAWISIREAQVASGHPQAAPLTVYKDENFKDKELDDEAGTESHATDHVRLTHCELDLRTSTSKAIFRINFGVCNLFRSHIDYQGFMEIHA